MAKNYITGARATLKLDNKPVGYAQGVTIREAVEYQPAEVLGNVEVDEFVPIRAPVEMQCRMFRLFGEGVKTQGWFPQIGTNPEEHLLNILNAGEMSAVIEDTVKKQPIATVEGVKIASHNWTVDRGTITGEDVMFVAKRVRDESGG